jgi:hypothetical protein
MFQAICARYGEPMKGEALAAGGGSRVRVGQGFGLASVFINREKMSL